MKVLFQNSGFHIYWKTQRLQNELTNKQHEAQESFILCLLRKLEDEKKESWSHMVILKEANGPYGRISKVTTYCYLFGGISYTRSKT